MLFSSRVAARQRRVPRVLPPATILGLTVRAADLFFIGIAAWLATRYFGMPSGVGDEALFAGVGLLLAISAFNMFRLYDVERLSNPLGQMPLVVLAWPSVISGALIIFYMLAPEMMPSQAWLLAWLLMGAVGLALGRLVLRSWVRHLQLSGQFGWNVVLVGGGQSGPRARRLLNSDRLHARIVGYVDLGQFPNPDDAVMEIVQQLRARPVDQVALALSPEQAPRLPELIAILRNFPIEVGVVPEPVPGVLPVLGARRLGQHMTLTYLAKPIDGWSWHVKAVFDAVVAALLLIVLAPLMLAIALGVKVTSPGPVFFRQKRLGFNQQPIDVFKFRSMYVDLCDAPAANEVKQATRNDPRITPLGRFLRKSSFDELPQLFNVIRGDMSLVGPRPHAVAHDEYYADLIDGYLARHRVKPGLTGWAQVNGCRGEIHNLEEMRRRIKLDLHYIDHWSLWLDIKILIRTGLVVFNDERAY